MTIKTAARKATIGLAASVLAATLTTGLAAAPANADLQGTATFTTPGNYSWTVPAFVNTIDIELFGAAGGDQLIGGQVWDHGAPGGRVQESVPVTPGQTYAIVVGGKGGASSDRNGGTGGFGGGGNGGPGSCVAGAGGGGRSAVWFLNVPIAVAGGGGGVGGVDAQVAYGAGGGLVGASGRDFFGHATGGTQSAGGAGSPDPGAAAGGFGFGGAGGTQDDCISGGGGGAGWYGGGGGGASGGGGGSSYVAPGLNHVRNEQGVRADAGGAVTIHYGTATPAHFAAPLPPHAVAGKPFSYQVPTTGWPSPDVVLTSGSLPAGLAIDANGVVTGTPTAIGSSTVSAYAVNDAGVDFTQLTFVVDGVAPSFSTTTIPPANVNEAYSSRILSAGFPVPALTLVAGALPAGITLAPDGTLSGTATSTGTFRFTLQLASSAFPAVRKAFSLVVQPPPTVSVGSVSVAEGSGGGVKLVAFPVTLSHTTSRPVTVTFSTSDGTAGSPVDYAGTTLSLYIAPGARTAKAYVQVNGDADKEPAETFTVTLSNPGNASLGTAVATGTITNDD